MSQTISMAADVRTGTGKGVARKLRQAGRVPAVVYGPGREPESLSVSAAELGRALVQMHGDFKTTVIDLDVGGRTVSTLIREMQRHPLRQDVIHIDFQEVRADQEITVEVPLHLVGVAAGVRLSGGVLDQALRTVEISVLPRYIPEHIDVDVSALDIGHSVHVSDLRIENARVLTDAAQTICSVVPPRVEEAAAPGAAAELAEPEVIRRAKAEDEGAEA